MGGPERHRSAQAQHPTRLQIGGGDFRFSFAEIMQQPQGPAVKDRAGLGQRQFARRPLEQPGSEAFLEPRNQLADPGWCHLMLVSRPGKAAVSNNACKDTEFGGLAQQAKTRHVYVFQKKQFMNFVHVNTENRSNYQLRYRALIALPEPSE